MESARKQYEAEHERYDGCKGIELPDAPPTSFVLPPCDASGGFVLGGKPFLTARGARLAAAQGRLAAVRTRERDPLQRSALTPHSPPLQVLRPLAAVATHPCSRSARRI